MQRSSQDTVDAYLRFMSARQVQESCISAYRAKLINGPPSEIEKYRQSIMSAAEAIADALTELVYFQMRDDGIDPMTRTAI